MKKLSLFLFVFLFSSIFARGARCGTKKNCQAKQPLHYFAEVGCLKGLKDAWKDGADFSVKNKFGLTPFQLALIKGHEKIVWFLARNVDRVN